MIVQPKVRGFICTTAHPEGCRAIVKEQIDYVKAQPKTEGPKKVLVIGASMGYGLSSRIAAAYSCGAATLGVIFDRNGSEKRTGTAGWYNTAAFESFAKADGLYARTVNGDAYSKEVKEEVISIIKEDLGKVGMVVYSLAAPKRVLADGTVCGSVLKTTGEPYTNKTIDLKNRTISEVTIGPATEEEIENTVKVMGGEDWRDWIEALSAADVLEKDAVTVAYSYIGPEITHPIYADGSIGRAKEHLYRTAQEMNEELSGVRAYVSVNKALVTQSSAAIPVVPLYISILYKVMKEKGVHEGCIEQMYRLFHDKLYGIAVRTDTNGYVRLDDYEMQPDVQEEVLKIWDALSNENLEANADLDGYWEDFYRLFGFHAKNVDYDADVDVVVPIAHVE